MDVAIRRRFVACAALAALASACSGGSGSASDGGRAADGGTIDLAPELRLPEDDPGFDRVEVLEDRLVFHFARAPSVAIEEGDLLAGASGPGYLRRALSVAFLDPLTLEVLTEQATLAEAIGEGDVVLDLVPDPPTPEGAGTAPLTESLPFRADLVGEPGNGIYVEGSMSMTLDASIEARFVNFDVESLRVVLSPEIAMSVNLVAEVTRAVSASGMIDLLEAAEFPSFPFFFTLGPLPVKGKIEVGFTLGYEAGASGRIGAQAGYGMTLGGEIGMAYADERFSDIVDYSLTAGPVPLTGEASAEAHVRAYLQPEVRIVLYGVGGPVFTLQRGFELAVDGSGTEGCLAWDLATTFTGSASLRADVSVPIIGRRFRVNYTIERLPVDRRPLARGRIGTCPCEAHEGRSCCEGGECAEGWLCGPDSVCRGGYDSALPCADDTHCPLWFNCGPDGFCRTGRRGDPCLEDSHCASGSGFACSPAGFCTDGGVGDPCVADADCAETGNCGSRGVCTWGEAGDPCTALEHCRLGLYCGPDGTCHLGLPGDRCDDPTDCVDYCGPLGVCSDGATGSACASGAECASGVCGPRGTCAAGACPFCGDPDWICDPSLGSCRYTCASGCSAGTTCGPTGVCAGGPGSPCDGDTDCTTASYCSPRGTCTAGADGDPCADDGDCDGICGPRGACQGGHRGDPCTTDAHCNEWMVCTPNGTCGGEIGDRCGSDADCSGTVCGPHGACMVGYEGDPCDGDADCPGRTDGSGLPLRCASYGRCSGGEQGDACGSASDCFSSAELVCSSAGVCQWGGIGDLCESDADCRTDEGMHCGPAGICIDGLVRDCLDDGDCYAGLSCDVDSAQCVEP